MDKETILQDFISLDILNPLINKTQNTLYLYTELLRNSDNEFFSILVDTIAFSNKSNKKALLISFANKDNVYTRYLETRYHLPQNIDITNSCDDMIDFAIRHSIEYPPKLISLNIHDKQINNLRCVIDSFIKNDIDKVFIRNFEITTSNLQFLVELQRLAIENKLMLVVQFRASKNNELLKEYSLNNVINIKQTKLNNKLVFYFENEKREKSQYYQLDFEKSKIKLIDN